MSDRDEPARDALELVPRELVDELEELETPGVGYAVAGILAGAWSGFLVGLLVGLVVGLLAGRRP